MARFNVGVGRQRVTTKTSSFEAGYVGELRGQFKSVAQTLKKIVSHIENVTPEALIHGLEPIHKQSLVFVPVWTGALKRSAFLEARKTTRGVSASIGFARGGSPHYAAHVHEAVGIPHRGDEQAKFLEAAVNMHIDKVQPRVADYMQRSIGLR